MKKLFLILFFAGFANAQPIPQDTRPAQTAAPEFNGSTEERGKQTATLQLTKFVPEFPVYVNQILYAGQDSVIGMMRHYAVKKNDSLIEIARKFNLGFNEIADANPTVDPFVPEAGIRVQIPTEWVLPDVQMHEGIIINVSEMRLYFFIDRNSPFVFTFPIGIGDDGKETPVGNFRVTNKTARPHWYVPKSIRNEDPRLPPVVPPGPNNPLGSHAMRLSLPSVLIHGTNKPWGIGRKVSHGCIHLYPEDIPWLFMHTKKGTRVTIVRQPVKVGTRANKVYVEVHNDGAFNYLREALLLLARKNLLGRINSVKLLRAVKERSGVPVIISD
jgi:L,D-transpeptidase ErfK/SrfK